ncbi:MAG: HsdM family class I SAM-dependent methyltransferase [Ilumatobacteraceae bacterium]
MAGREQLSLLPALDLAEGPAAVHGEVFTRRWVAELILDLAGYHVDAPLGTKVIVEPACGTGGFLVPIVERLLAAVGPAAIVECRNQIVALDIVPANVERARKEAHTVLLDAGVADTDAAALAEGWVRCGDFLLDDLPHLRGADFVVGNPPYVRLEAVAPATMRAYRAACPAMRGRSDLYVGFFERGLSALAPGGTLAFICADRWMHNQYGADLRELITTRGYAVDTVLKMHEVDAFDDSVSAYPAITVLRRAPQAEVVVADATRTFGPSSVPSLKQWMTRHPTSSHTTKDFAAARVSTWASGRSHWPAGSPEALAVVADLERRFPPLEDPSTHTRVGIGIATGADDVYLTDDPDLVEPTRLLPLLRSADIASGEVHWSGRYLVNPWDDDGLVSLAAHPRLAAHLNGHGQRVRGRHVAKRRPDSWYRTIDRVIPGLQHQRKLLLPDIKAASHPVLDDGEYYPHHNLYFVTSDGWDLEVLGGLLLSDIANLFVGTYCVKMRGGCYRFQAQYLRRVRVPDPSTIDATTATALIEAFRQRDREAATVAAGELYEVDIRVLRRAG